MLRARSRTERRRSCDDLINACKRLRVLAHTLSYIVALHRHNIQLPLIILHSCLGLAILVVNSSTDLCTKILPEWRSNGPHKGPARRLLRVFQVNLRQQRNCCPRHAGVHPTRGACPISHDGARCPSSSTKETLLTMNISDWNIIYRDRLDQDRISRNIPSKEAALKQARDLYRQQRAELYRIEGPNGLALPKEEIMRWMSTNKW